MATKKTATATKKAPTKSEVYRQIAEKTDLNRKDVAAVFDELQALVAKNVKKSGPGQFTIPGLCKIVVRTTKKVPAGERVNPFTGEKKWMPAKPARRVPKVRALKALKDMV